MQSLKSILDWWRLLAATLLTLPFVKWSLIIDEWLKALPAYWLTALVCILSVGIFLSTAYLFKLKSEHSNKLTLKYGIYWDKKKNTYCPVCEKPVSYSRHYYGGSGFVLGYHCNPCKRTYQLFDALGNSIKPEKVLSEL